ncbi:MAG: hypothetical protein QM796_22280 [Chthoniobacteraceae bacterium]
MDFISGIIRSEVNKLPRVIAAGAVKRWRTIGKAYHEDKRVLPCRVRLAPDGKDEGLDWGKFLTADFANNTGGLVFFRAIRGYIF